jgi:hypothetical protein
MFRQVRERIGTTWCTLAHDSLLWPIHGYYECRSCGRHFPAFGEAAHQSTSMGALPVRGRPASPSLSRA